MTVYWEAVAVLLRTAIARLTFNFLSYQEKLGAWASFAIFILTLQKTFILLPSRWTSLSARATSRLDGVYQSGRWGNRENLVRKESQSWFLSGKVRTCAIFAPSAAMCMIRRLVIRMVELSQGLLSRTFLRIGFVRSVVPLKTNLNRYTEKSRSSMRRLSW